MPANLVDEVTRHKKTLEDEASSEEVTGEALAELEALGEGITRAILSETKVGFAVGKVRQRFPALAPRAKKLIDTWKAALSTAKPKAAAPAAALTLLSAFDGPWTNDPKRDRWREALFKAFIEGLPTEQLEDLSGAAVGKVAASIETACWQHYVVNPREGNVAQQSKDYALQLRSIKTNFADRRNPEFNSRVFLGVITPQQLTIMPATEMASDAKKAERQRTKKESLEACQSDWDLRNVKREVGQFPCGKCKSGNTTYVQAQTRSADEPMTTYVTCIDCGNRWKF